MPPTPAAVGGGGGGDLLFLSFYRGVTCTAASMRDPRIMTRSPRNKEDARSCFICFDKSRTAGATSVSIKRQVYSPTTSLIWRNFCLIEHPFEGPRDLTDFFARPLLNLAANPATTNLPAAGKYFTRKTGRRPSKYTDSRFDDIWKPRRDALKRPSGVYVKYLRPCDSRGRPDTCCDELLYLNPRGSIYISIAKPRRYCNRECTFNFCDRSEGKI